MKFTKLSQRKPGTEELAVSDLFLCRQQIAEGGNTDFEYMVLWYDFQNEVFRDWHDYGDRDWRSSYPNVIEWAPLYSSGEKADTPEGFDELLKAAEAVYRPSDDRLPDHKAPLKELYDEVEKFDGARPGYFPEGQPPEASDFKYPGFLPGDHSLYLVQTKINGTWVDASHPLTYDKALEFFRSLAYDSRIIATVLDTTKVKCLEKQERLWSYLTKKLDKDNNFTARQIFDYVTKLYQ